MGDEELNSLLGYYISIEFHLLVGLLNLEGKRMLCSVKLFYSKLLKREKRLSYLINMDSESTKVFLST